MQKQLGSGCIWLYICPENLSAAQCKSIQRHSTCWKALKPRMKGLPICSSFFPSSHVVVCITAYNLAFAFQSNSLQQEEILHGSFKGSRLLLIQAVDDMIAVLGPEVKPHSFTVSLVLNTEMHS